MGLRIIYNLCMYMYIHSHINIYISRDTYKYIHTYTDIHTCIYTYIYMHIHMYKPCINEEIKNMYILYKYQCCVY